MKDPVIATIAAKHNTSPAQVPNLHLTVALQLQNAFEGLFFLLISDLHRVLPSQGQCGYPKVHHSVKNR